MCIILCLFVFYVPSTARSFREGTPIYCPLRRMWISVNTPFPSGIEPQAIVYIMFSTNLNFLYERQITILYVQLNPFWKTNLFE